MNKNEEKRSVSDMLLIICSVALCTSVITLMFLGYYRIWTGCDLSVITRKIAITSLFTVILSLFGGLVINDYQRFTRK